MTYSVDEVSDLLEVPRPTLYRYLREYSVPHQRRSGKIYIPEESFDRIKEVRELHKEGLATESVRRRLEEESNLDVVELAERLDRISESLESLQGNLESTNRASYAQVLQTILARQSDLISAVSNLTERLESLPYAKDQPQKLFSSDPEEETQQQGIFVEQLQVPFEAVEKDSVIATSSNSTKPLTNPARYRRFGAMSRRRRHGALAILLILLASTPLIIYATLNGEGSFKPSQEESSTREAVSAGSEGTFSRGPDSATSDSATSNEKKSAAYIKEGYEDPAQERPFYQEQYQAQDVTPDLPSQKQPVLKSPPDSTGLPHLTFGNDNVQPALDVAMP